MEMLSTLLEPYVRRMTVLKKSDARSSPSIPQSFFAFCWKSSTEHHASGR